MIICCVLKSGGVYTPIYVDRLYKACRKFLVGDFDFVCLTDYDPEDFIPGVKTIRLKKNYPSWWSKIEAFRIEDEQVLYLDLDTVIASFIGLYNLQRLRPVAMLKPFRQQERWASGVMYWQGSLKFVFDEFIYAIDSRVRWDQRYISAKIEEHVITINPVQKAIMVASYKHDCKIGVPFGTQLVCFHGYPRPHQVTSERWLDRLWRGDAN